MYLTSYRSEFAHPSSLRLNEGAGQTGQPEAKVNQASQEKKKEILTPNYINIGMNIGSNLTIANTGRLNGTYLNPTLSYKNMKSFVDEKKKRARQKNVAFSGQNARNPKIPFKEADPTNTNKPNKRISPNEILKDYRAAQEARTNKSPKNFSQFSWPVAPILPNRTTYTANTKAHDEYLERVKTRVQKSLQKRGLIVETKGTKGGTNKASNTKTHTNARKHISEEIKKGENNKVNNQQKSDIDNEKLRPVDDKRRIKDTVKVVSEKEFSRRIGQTQLGCDIKIEVREKEKAIEQDKDKETKTEEDQKHKNKEDQRHEEKVTNNKPRQAMSKPKQTHLNPFSPLQMKYLDANTSKMSRRVLAEAVRREERGTSGKMDKRVYKTSNLEDYKNWQNQSEYQNIIKPYWTRPKSKQLNLPGTSILGQGTVIKNMYKTEYRMAYNGK